MSGSAQKKISSGYESPWSSKLSRNRKGIPVRRGKRQGSFTEWRIRIKKLPAANASGSSDQKQNENLFYKKYFLFSIYTIKNVI